MRSAQRKLFVIGFLFFALSICLFAFTQKARAGELTSLIRIDRHTASTTTGGLVCATTPSTNTGTENNVRVLFPPSFIVNTNAANWAVDTSDIPNTSIPWPGISTASNVSGQTVTFPSNDLSPNTQYCFSFASSNTLTTPSVTGSFEGTIQTRNSSNTILDSKNFGIPIIDNDQIAVTATVPANPTDFSAQLEMISPSNDFFHSEDDILTYRLTYGSTLSTPTNIVVEAEWGLGTIKGGSTPTEDLLDYVIGSASYGYNSAPPVIDVANRKITWTINNIPATTTGQTVTFQLKINTTLTTTQPVTFTVSGRVLGPGTQTADSDVDSIFQRRAFITPTPTPTCAPGTCPTPTPAPTGIPTPTQPPKPKPRITNIEIRSINSSEATIYVSTSLPTTVRIDLGDTPTTLRIKAFSSKLSRQHLLKVDKLQPNTRYLFRVIAQDEDKVTVNSDLYALKTAFSSVAPQAITNSLIVTSGDVILVDNHAASNVSQFIIPVNTTFSFKFNIADFQSLKLVTAILRNGNVLGITTSEEMPVSTDSIVVSEVSPGQFVGKLLTPTLSGNYKLIMQIQDYYGNIVEQNISNIFIVQHITVQESTSKRGIENAKLTFYHFNTRTRTYELLTSAITPLKNPIRSDSDGSVKLVLPEGKYKATVQALGYEEKEVVFDLSSKNRQFYPQITLTPMPFNIFLYGGYLGEILKDFGMSLHSFLSTIGTSYRLYNLFALFLIAFLVMLATIATSRKLCVPIWLLPYFGLYQLERLFHIPKHTYVIHGKVITTGAGEVVSGATVYISHPKGKIIAHTRTNSSGEFFSKVHEATNLRLTVGKKGFSSNSTIVITSLLEKRVTLAVTQTGKPKTYSYNNLKWYVEYLLTSFFEAFLIIVFIAEILFGLKFGWIQVVPFIFLSALNVILWAINIRPPRT